MPLPLSAMLTSARPWAGLGEKDVRGELLKKLHVAGTDAQAAHLELRTRPRRLESARRDAEFGVALDQAIAASRDSATTVTSENWKR